MKLIRTRMLGLHVFFCNKDCTVKANVKAVKVRQVQKFPVDVGKILDIEAADLADSLMMAAPGPVLMVFVSSSRVRLLPGYVNHSKSCPAESGNVWKLSRSHRFTLIYHDIS